ncbi:hypothetical protein [Streptomyces sp. NPDC020607]|uniref:hypothetical protein n=1 Tax=Streptomyces sp. NPDC020607 TaxID=3365082 RepID=UPI003790C034
MVKHRRRKLDARKLQEWTGESFQRIVDRIKGSPIVWTAEREAALNAVHGIRFHDALSEARKAADRADIEAVEDFARTRLHLGPGKGLEVAKVFWLYRGELDRANDRALPGLVHRILKDEEEGRPSWSHQASEKPVLTYDGLRPPGVDGVSGDERTSGPDLRLMDPRVGTLLNCLTAEERKVLHARCTLGTTTWSGAASFANAPDPHRTGDQVRRKVQRLAAELWGRAA